MYNLGMKNIVENNVKSIVKKHKYNTLLTLIIFILFCISGYSNEHNYQDIYVKGKQVSVKHGIYTNNSEQYIHIEDITEVFKDYIYSDKISGKLIITTYNKFKKIEINDEDYIIKVDNDRYCNLQKFMAEIGYDVAISKSSIYINDIKYIEGQIIKNRTEIYNNETAEIICFLDKNYKVNISINEKLSNTKENVINVRATINGKRYYGYVLKDNVNYKYSSEETISNDKKFILVKAEDKLETSTDVSKVNMVTINMYRLSGANILTKLEYVNNVPKTVDVYAGINNGQNSSNYDSDIITRMLNSQSNRENIINQIVENLGDLSGVNLDFTNFKVSDKENYTQFIKELAAILHLNNKKLIVNAPNAQYIDIKEVSKYVDYLIVQQYYSRTLSSKTSGPISSLNYVENILQQLKNEEIDMNKIILELPSYTILWTERKGTVINAELYNMKTMKAYLEENDIQPKLDGISGQNYINHTKGITTYKMWLEDEYSMLEKTKLANKYNLAGISIYRSGLEQKTIYNSISKLLEI